MSLLTLLLTSGCESTESIEGKVVDIWGMPIEGATVMIVGGTERPMTDADGRYRLARSEGRLEMKAGCKGYIQDHEEIVVEAGQPAEGPLFELYPKPAENGFHLVATGRYQQLPPQKVRSVGNALQQFRGVSDHGEVATETTRPRVILHTELRQDEILRLGLRLRRLDYLAEAEIPGPTGNARVAVNLWVDGGPVELDIVPLRSKTDFLLTPKEALSPGSYAFETQALLSGGAAEGQEALGSIPEELRVAFPFEVR